MSKQRSWCCGFIPGFWWWFLALVGLPLLFLLMTYFRQGVIESDLTNRVSEALSAENIDWAEVDVQHRGRDVLLRGVPPDDASREQALQIAQGVYGVNIVDLDENMPVLNGAEAEAAIIMPTFNAQMSDGKLVLQGSLPSQQQVDEIATAAEQRFGVDNVSNQLVVGEGVATPEWLSSADDLLGIIPDNDTVLKISDQGIEIDSEVESDDVKQSMLTLAKDVLGDDVTDNIRVKSLLPPQIEMALADGKMTLHGTLSSQQQVDSLMQTAAERVGEENVNNNLVISDKYAEADWLSSAQQLASGLLAENGTAKITGDTLEIKADVDSEEAREKLVAESNAALQDSGLILVNNVTVSPVEGTPTVQESAAEAALACQQRLDSAMQDQKILFRVGKADIRNQSYGLLDNLVGILTDCKDALAGSQVVIGGHTDSDGGERYNLNLSQRRADAVRKYMTDKGVSTDLLTAKGFGEAAPVASNNTAAGKAENRRISFEIKAAE